MPATLIKKFPDLMIDFEACSTQPDAAPHQLGVAFFDLHDPQRKPYPLQIDIHVISCLRVGFSICPETLVWWADTLKKPVVLDKGHPLDRALTELESWIARFGEKDLRVWSRGNSYDLSIARLGFARCHIPLPWNYHRERDVRSHLDALGYEKRSSNSHVAMLDALNQVGDLHAARPQPPPAIPPGDPTVYSYGEFMARILADEEATHDLGYTLIPRD